VALSKLPLGIPSFKIICSSPRGLRLDVSQRALGIGADAL
jgi:hypothetical protein